MTRIAQLTDPHVWRLDWRPWRLVGKRALGMANLLLKRRRQFPPQVFRAAAAHVASLGVDHVIVTGDLTQTALDSEFAACHEALGPLLDDPARVTVIPGNHDRYTRESVASRRFEQHFGAFGAADGFPFTRDVGANVRLIALDPCRPTGLNARGHLPKNQLILLPRLIELARADGRVPFILCHYPFAAPPDGGLHADHELDNGGALVEALRGRGPLVYAHGHIHRVWALVPDDAPDVLCVGAGSSGIVFPEAPHGLGPVVYTFADGGVEIERHIPAPDGSFRVEPLARHRFDVGERGA